MDIYSVQMTAGAERDLEDIYDYLSANAGRTTADDLVADLLERIETLERFPQRGSIPKELASLGIHDFRQIVRPPYRLIYRIIAREVFILLVADGRRDMQLLLERRLLGR